MSAALLAPRGGASERGWLRGRCRGRRSRRRCGLRVGPGRGAEGAGARAQAACLARGWCLSCWGD